jgi:hypothetical protein
MTADDFRQRARDLRQIPLETVLIHRGAVRDPRDRAKWHTEQGPISVTGPKFTNWHQQTGGGGAIDLVMHLAQVDYRAAVAWLEQFAPSYAAAAPAAAASFPAQSSVRAPHSGKLQLPSRDDGMLDRVRRYLIERRHLAPAQLESLLQSQRLYADRRGNAVFLLVTGRPNRPVGAELRGTGPRPWRGMAPGTHKDSGYFWVGATGAQQLILCESAIDAISCFQLHPASICISTSGVRSNPRWLPKLIARGYQIRCGFDADEAGDTAAARMITLHPRIIRLRPPAHDWNDALSDTH